MRNMQIRNQLTNISKPDTDNKSLGTIAALSALVLLSACGSGGNSGSGDAGADPVTPVEIISLDHMSDNDLQRSASTGSKQMQSGMRNTQNFITQSDVVTDMSGSGALSGLSLLLGMSGESSSVDEEAQATGFGTDDTEIHDFEDDEHDEYGDDAQFDDSDPLTDADIWADAGVDGLIDISLGLQGNADVTRDGNTVFIDPDDAALCQHELLASDATAQEQQFCELMVSDLTVRIDGQTEDAGNISYLYQDQALLNIHYAPDEASYKVHLDGVYLVIQKANAIDPVTFDNVPEAFSGAFELGMKILTNESGQESNSMFLSISAPIVVTDREAGFDLNLAASNLLTLQHNNAAGTASIEVDAGAATLSIADGNQIDFVSPGSTVRVDLLNNGDRISVSKLGFRNGPVTVSIDSVEVMRMTLSTFGFDVDSSGAIKLTGALDFDVMLSLMDSLMGNGQGDVLNLNLGVGAPGGARFVPLADGATKLEDAGPFNIDLSVSSNEFSEQQNFTVNQGECFSESVDGNALFSQVVCP